MRTDLFKNSDWLKANKVSINISKTNFIIFHNVRAKEDLALKLPLLSIDCLEIKKVTSTKFVNENMTRELQINLVQKNISKSLGIKFNAKALFDFKLLPSLYYFFIHKYLVMQT